VGRSRGPERQDHLHGLCFAPDAVLYLCQVLWVFEDLCKGITEQDLRAKFVSGLVLSGFPPDKDASFFFERA